jgi:hypothetical protein
VIRRVRILLVGSLVFWGLTAGLAYLVWEDQREVVVGYSVAALTLCLVPATATLVWILWNASPSPDQQMVAVLGGTGVRMFFVLGAGLVMTSQVAFFQRRSFWIWLLVYYLFTLTLEMILLRRP